MSLSAEAQERVKGIGLMDPYKEPDTSAAHVPMGQGLCAVPHYYHGGGYGWQVSNTFHLIRCDEHAVEGPECIVETTP